MSQMTPFTSMKQGDQDVIELRKTISSAYAAGTGAIGGNTDYTMASRALAMEGVGATERNTVTAAYGSVFSAGKQLISEALSTISAKATPNKKAPPIEKSLAMEEAVGYGLAALTGISQYWANQNAGSTPKAVMERVTAMEEKGSDGQPRTIARYVPSPTPSFVRDRSDIVANLAANKWMSPLGGGDAASYIAEQFDNTPNRDVVINTATFNSAMTRQDPVIAMNYPMVVVPPTDYGLGWSLPILYMMKDTSHSANGKPTDFGRVNLINAEVDAQILKSNSTEIIPIYRRSTPGNPDTDTFNFFPAFISDPTTGTRDIYKIDGVDNETGPVLNDTDYNLLGLGQTALQLSTKGKNNYSDAIDPSVRLDTLVFEIANNNVTEVIYMDMGAYPGSDFVPAQQATSTRLMQINFATDAMPFTKGMATRAGVPSTIMDLLSTYTVYLSIEVNGSIRLDDGITKIRPIINGVRFIRDAKNVSVSLTDPAVAALVTFFNDRSKVKCTSHKLRTHTVNNNRRDRGPLIDNQSVQFWYSIPTLSPMSRVRPINQSDSQDGEYVADLVSSIRKQATNRGIDALLENCELIKQLHKAGNPVTLDSRNVFSPIMLSLNVAYYEKEVVLPNVLDSLDSSHRIEDMQSVLMNTFREGATILRTTSLLHAIYGNFYDGKPPKPVVMLTVPPRLETYLTITGDNRYLGDTFDYRIESTPDNRFWDATKDECLALLTFGNQDAFTSGRPHPLHNGFTAWRPEAVLTLPNIRDNRNVFEITVCPTYRYVQTLGIMGKFIIKGINQVIAGKEPISVRVI